MWAMGPRGTGRAGTGPGRSYSPGAQAGLGLALEEVTAPGHRRGWDWHSKLLLVGVGVTYEHPCLEMGVVLGPPPGIMF